MGNCILAGLLKKLILKFYCEIWDQKSIDRNIDKKIEKKDTSFVIGWVFTQILLRKTKVKLSFEAYEYLININIQWNPSIRIPPFSEQPAF